MFVCYVTAGPGSVCEMYTIDVCDSLASESGSLDCDRTLSRVVSLVIRLAVGRGRVVGDVESRFSPSRIMYVKWVKTQDQKSV